MIVSSADWMTRNMEKRIELSFPIHCPRIKQKIKHILDLRLQDNVKARIQDEYGRYDYVQRQKSEQEVDSQSVMFREAYQAAELVSS
jgi:polyphosphate kinase